MNPDEPLRTKNLAKEDPAPMDDALCGFPWLPRLIDKARSESAGTLGGYYKYPCPIDSQCLALLSITAAEFQKIATEATTARDVLLGLRKVGDLGASARAFDPLALNTRLHESTIRPRNADC